MKEQDKPSNNNLMHQLQALPGGEHLVRCYSCGTCVSRCLIQQRFEPEYNPRRLLRKIVMGLAQESFKDKTTWLCSACDLCYPACPQQIRLSELILAIRTLAIEAGHTTPLITAVVNQQTCVGCGLCLEVCPYQAISLQEIPNGKHGLKTVAKVGSSLCLGCGLCAANCRSTSIALKDEFSFELLVEEMWEWIAEADLPKWGI